jgi:hypothetical protein
VLYFKRFKQGDVMERWIVAGLFFIGSSYLFVTATTTKETIEALATFGIDFVLVFMLWYKEHPIAKKLLDLF